jgi:hypothetical protein
VYREGSIDDPPEILDGHRAWMATQLVQMEKVFGRLLPGLNAAA